MVILYDDGSLYYQDIKAFLNIKKIEYTEVPAGDTEYSLSVNELCTITMRHWHG